MNVWPSRFALAVPTTAMILTGVAQVRAQTAYDIVIKVERVIDPQTSLDAVRDVKVTGDRIAASGKL